MDILQRIRDLYPQLTKKQRGIADFLLKSPEDICYITLAQLSRQTGSSELTLLRFCEKVGCSCFLDLKQEFREYTQHMIKLLSAPAYFIPSRDVSDKTGKASLLTDICHQEAAAMADFTASLNLHSITSAADNMRKSRRIFIFAHDISNVLGTFLKSRLCLLHFDSTLIDLANLSETQGCLLQLCREDLVVMFSFPQYYYPLGSIARKVGASGACIVTITNSATSPAAAHSNHLLLCPTTTKLFYNTLTLPMALLNLLSSALVIEMVPPSERNHFKDTLSS